MPQDLYFEDIKPGDQHRVGPHLVDKAELMDFARQWDPLPIHVDEEFAIASQGGISAPGLYILALKMRLLHQVPIVTSVVATFGYDEVRFLAPVRPGDALTLVLDWLEQRRSKSRPDCGTVKFRVSLINQDDKPVMTHFDTVLMRLREPGV